MPRFLLVIALAMILVAAVPVHAQERPGSQVLIEMGWAKPFGELGEDFEGTALGFGAGAGLEVGFRWRYYLSRSLSISPAFHFVDYKDHEGQYIEYGTDVGGAETIDYVDYRIANSSIRWTVEFLLATAEPTTTVRPFLALGAGVYRNRTQGFTKEFTVEFDNSINTLGVSLRAGIQVSTLEFSAIYHLNRFSTHTYFSNGRKQDYNWDSFVLRGAWAIPFAD